VISNRWCICNNWFSMNRNWFPSIDIHAILVSGKEEKNPICDRSEIAESVRAKERQRETERDRERDRERQKREPERQRETERDRRESPRETEREQ
jgi:hypothetical protein